jgi:UDP-glucose 4-epimerase
MRVLVTGGAGFIGSHIVDALVGEGHGVWILDDLSTGKEENLNDKATFVRMDIADEALEEALFSAKPEVVFHCAAQIDVRKSISDPKFDARTNIIGTINLLESCRAWGTRKVVFSSSGGTIYGNVEKPATEDFPVHPLSPYAISKLSCEYYIKCYSEWYSLKHTILRYANVFGPRQDPLGEAGVVAIFANIMLKGQTPILYGHGKMVRDYVYVTDAVRANLSAVEGGTGETLNVGTARPTRVKELFDTMASILSFDGKPEMQPARKGELASNFLSYARTRRVLGWEPEVSLEEGLERTIEWFRERLP